MRDFGVKTTVAGGFTGFLGGGVGVYLKGFCTVVDETDPASVLGIMFSTSLTAVTTANETKQMLQTELQNQCASSEKCTAISEAGATTVETISSMWDNFTAGTSTAAKQAYLRYDVKDKVGKVGENFYKEILEKIDALVSEVRDTE